MHRRRLGVQMREEKWHEERRYTRDSDHSSGPAHRMRCGSLAAAFTVALPSAAHADRVTPPPVPENIVAPAETKAFLVGHAVGTQDYICLPAGWRPFGPQATLFNDDAKQVITHFLSPNPDRDDMPFATWQHSQDTSAVWATMIAIVLRSRLCRARCHSLVPASGGRRPRRADRWPKADQDNHIQRLNTTGGMPPSSPCGQGEVGNKELVRVHGRLLLLQEPPRRRLAVRRRFGRVEPC